MSAAVREAHAVLHMAAGVPSCDMVRLTAALADALEVYEGLDSDALHWEPIWPHLRDEADPEGEALAKAELEVEAAAEDLVKVMAAHCGLGAAR
jgi:hypothetical protein